MDQFDLFEDSRDVMLRNDLAGAVLRGDAAAAGDAARALEAEFPRDAALGPASLLTAHLERQPRASSPAPLDAQLVLAARRELVHELVPAAHALLGPLAADAWIVDQWSRLAQHAARVPWRADAADAHAAALFAEARAWPEVIQAVQGIASWRRIPQPLLWIARARWQMQGADAGWPLVAEALWIAPAPAHALLATIGLFDTRLKRLARKFEQDFEPAQADDWAWLPAWALVEQPLLAEVLDTASADSGSAPEQGCKLVLALLRLERQGRHHDVIAHRRQLQASSPRLFAAYMRTR